MGKPESISLPGFNWRSGLGCADASQATSREGSGGRRVTRIGPQLDAGSDDARYLTRALTAGGNSKMESASGS